jgi:hypothetical protein
VRAAYTSLVSAPSAQTAADTVVKAKAAGLDGVFVATNNNQFVAGKHCCAGNTLPMHPACVYVAIQYNVPVLLAVPVALLLGAACRKILG